MDEIAERIEENTGVDEHIIRRATGILSEPKVMKSHAVSEAYQVLIKNSDPNPSVVWNQVLKPLYVSVNEDTELRSWRVASGFGFKYFIKHYYESILPPQYSIRMRRRSEREQIVDNLKFPNQVTVNDLRITIEVKYRGKQVLAGVLHAQTGLRGTFNDLTSVSEELLRIDYFTPLLTLDHSSILGKNNRSPKRQKVLENKYFSGIYCFNMDVEPTSGKGYQTSVKTMELNDTRDVFVKDLEGYCLSIDSEILENRAIEVN